MQTFATRSLGPYHPNLMALLLAVAASLGGGLGCSDDQPPAGPLPPLPMKSRPVSAQFTLTVNPADAALQSGQQQPIASAVQVSGGSADLGLLAFVRKEAQTPTRLWVELYLVNHTTSPLSGVTLKVSDLQNSPGFYNFTDEPLAQTMSPPELAVGAFAPEGIEHLSLGVQPTTVGQKIAMTLAVGGQTSAYTATSSAPLQLSSDDKELWVAQPDANAVAVVDTASGQRSALIPVAGGPTGLAITPDDKFVLVTSGHTNQLSVLDRASRTTVQTFSETDGIGRDPRHVVISPDGSLAFVSAYVGDRVTKLSRTGDHFAVTGSVQVARRPVGMSITADGATLLVAHFLPRGKLTENSGIVSVLDINALAAPRELPIVDDTNVAPLACIAALFHLPPDQAINLSSEGVPTQLAGVFLSPSGTQGWIPGLRVGGVIPIWEGDVGKVGLGPIQGRFAAGMMFVLNSRDGHNTSAQRQPGVIDFPDTPLDTLRCLDPRTEIEVPSSVSLMPGVLANPAAAFPSAMTGLSETGVARFVAFTRGGRRALMASFIADELIVYDALTKNPTSLHHFMLSGSNPVGIAVTHDGRRGYVTYENSLFVSVLDLSAYADPAGLPGPSFVPYQMQKLPGPPATTFTQYQVVRYIDQVPEVPPIKEVAQLALVQPNEDPVDPELRRGRVLFESSNPTKYPQLTVSREGSCAVCHPMGGNDGSAWGTMEGERRTLGLWGGTAGRGWLHQSATHRDAGEFVRTIIPERLGGQLTSEADFDAIARYLAFGVPRLQAPPVDAGRVAAGKQIFQASCAGCHAGDHYTSGQPLAGDPLGGGDPKGPVLLDVGTATDSAHVIIGPLFAAMLPPMTKQAFDLSRGDRQLGTGDPLQLLLGFRQRPDRMRGQLKAPSLINVWDNSLFFHDGRFDKLEDAVHYMNTQLKLGLNTDDEAAVTEFLYSL